MFLNVVPERPIIRPTRGRGHSITFVTVDGGRKFKGEIFGVV